MKHVVTLTTSNPAHEHVSLRRKQSTTNFMVEAVDEEQAILRASAHFRRLGHYIHEAKIFKKKDEQLNEFVDTSTKPFNKETNIGSVVAGSTKNVGNTQQQSSSNRYYDPRIEQWVTRQPDQSDADWETQKRTEGQAIVAWGDKPVVPVFPELDILGGISRSASAIWSILRGGVKPRPRPNVPSPPRRGPARPMPGQQPRPRPRPRPRPNPTPQPAPEPSPQPAPQPAPKPAPQPAPKPAPAPQPAPKPAPQPAPKPAPAPQPLPGPRTSPLPLPGPRPAPQSQPGRGVRPRTPIIPSPFGFEADRGETDIRTLGQYRGLARMYQFHDFSESYRLQEGMGSVKNAIGRVLAKRKQATKINAESEPNKINMEPKLTPTAGSKI